MSRSTVFQFRARNSILHRADPLTKFAWMLTISLLALEAVRKIDAIFVVTDGLGIHREMLVIPLGPATPGSSWRVAEFEGTLARTKSLRPSFWISSRRARITALRFAGVLTTSQ